MATELFSREHLCDSRQALVIMINGKTTLTELERSEIIR